MSHFTIVKLESSLYQPFNENLWVFFLFWHFVLKEMNETYVSILNQLKSMHFECI